MFAPDMLTRDEFLGGRLGILQPKKGYRAGVDPVLLAASVPARAGQSVLELGCGAGVASLCLMERVAGLDVAGLEIQPEYADLARQNAEANAMRLDVHEGDLRAMPSALRARRFDHVIANPPYHRSFARSPAQDEGREMAFAGEAALDDWAAAASRRLLPRGYLTAVLHTSRLPEFLEAVSARLGSVEIFPIAPRAGREAGRFILRARKGGRADFRLHAPIIMHEGDAHAGDRESYTPHLRGVLREGRPLLPDPA